MLALVGVIGQNYWQLRTERLDMSRGDRLFPFSSLRKRMTTLIHNSVGGDADGQRVYSKGAAEIVLESCKFQTKANGARNTYVLGVVDVYPIRHYNASNVVGVDCCSGNVNQRDRWWGDRAINQSELGEPCAHC